jgi:aminopeptidase
MNEEHSWRYARLLVELGVGLRRRQPLYVYGQVAHRELVAMLTEVAYEAGSGPVATRFFDPLQHSALIRRGRFEDIELCHVEDQAWYSEIIRHGGAYVCLQGPEFPRFWDELARSHPERHAAYQRGAREALSGFFRFGVDVVSIPWVAAPWPTAGLAREVFPGLAEGAARDRLAELIFEFTYANREDALELAAARDRRLKRRCRLLDELGIREIRIVGGGSDLRVGLSPRARWLGGSHETAGGQTCYLNIPTEEVFTTPDRRRACGQLEVTRPFRLNTGPLVEGLTLRFQGGRVVELDASRGREGFERWLATDAGARRLGEIALVGEDSAIARSGLFFGLNILDENASSHVALGKGFFEAFAGGESMKPREIEKLGCNASAVHADLMFGSAAVSVLATRSREGEVVLIDQGRWADRFEA